MNTVRIREVLLGRALDPMKAETRHSLALAAFLALQRRLHFDGLQVVILPMKV